MEDAMPEQQDFPLPAKLPVPVDDGAARHLRDMRVPNILLRSTSGALVDLNNAGAMRAATYCYPITGVPGKALPEGWDLIPGAPVFPPNESAEQALDWPKKHPA
jgi:hypothetical protein